MYARKIGCVVGMMHSNGIFGTEVKIVIGICKILARVSTIKVAGYLKRSLMTSSNSIVNISSPILHSYMIFTAQILQYVIV